MDKKVVVGIAALVTAGLIGGGYLISRSNEDDLYDFDTSGGTSGGDSVDGTDPPQDCALPTIVDPYIGFEIGKPDGWSMNAAGGAVIVRKDPAGSELALVYPVVLEGATAEDLFEGYSGVLTQTAQAQGGDLSFTKTGTDTISGDVTGSFAGSDVTGSFSVAPLEEQTLFAAYWAPTSEFEAERETLDQIVSCYSKRIGTPLQRFQGSYFHASFPSDWQMTGETSNGIDLTSGAGDAGVSFAYAGNVPGVGDARGLTQYAIANLIPMQNVQIVAEQHLGTSTDQLGITWEVLASEFDAVVDGDPVHGIMTMTIADAGFGAYTGMWVIRLARTDRWDHYSNLLAAIQESIVITRVETPGQGMSLSSSDPSDPVTSSDGHGTSATDENFEGWSEAMLGFETVQSPSTGDTFDVPLNSWDPTEGGYVRPLPGGGTELLEDY